MDASSTSDATAILEGFCAALHHNLLNTFPGLIERNTNSQFVVRKPQAHCSNVTVSLQRVINLVRDIAKVSSIKIPEKDGSSETTDIRFEAGEQVGRILITPRDMDFLITIEGNILTHAVSANA